MELFYTPKTRATRARWLLEEMGESYELVRLDFTKGDHKKPEYLKINPLGKVPALKDGKVTMFESGAILVYLAEKFGKLIPTQGSPKRAEFFQWMFFGAGEFDTAIIKVFYHTVKYPEAEREPKIAEEGRKQFHPLALILEERLRHQPFLLGDEFSSVDVMVGSLVMFAGTLKMLNDYPVLQAYGSRLKERPAYRRAIAD